MHLPDQAQRQRQLLQPFKAVHHGVDVVRDFADVVDRLACLRLGLEAEKIREGRLGALYLRGKNGFLPHVHVEEQLLAWQQHSDAVQPSQSAFRQTQLLQQGQHVDRRLRRQRRRHESTHDFTRHRGLYEAA